MATVGIVAEIGSGAPIVVLRADMDALPITEATDLPYASTHPGFMHACGHDAHTSMLLGAAKILKERSDAGGLPEGTVRLLFQPAEEGGAGGRQMVKEGALEGVAGAFGMHVVPDLPTGALTTRPGALLAGDVPFDVTLTGAGSHAAQPHKSRDPVVAAAAFISAIQSLVARETDAVDSLVISITRLQAGDGAAQARNIVPTSALVGGTIRALRPATSDHVRTRILAIAEHVAAAYGVEASVDWREEADPHYPPLVNDKATATLALATATELVGPRAAFLAPHGAMGSEDFAFIAAAVPSAFLGIGVGGRLGLDSPEGFHTPGTVFGAPVHTPTFRVDPHALPVGAALHASLATRFLEKEAAAKSASEEGARGAEAAGHAEL